MIDRMQSSNAQVIICTEEGDSTVTGDTDAEGGNLSDDWLTKGVESWYYNQIQKKINQNYLINKLFGGSGNDKLVDERNKSALRANEILGVLSGFPIIGGIINGIQGVRQMEDLYDKTGKTAAYPGLQSLGAGGLGAAASQMMRIADGQNDLYKYYAGEPDQWTINLYG